MLRTVQGTVEVLLYCDETCTVVQVVHYTTPEDHREVSNVHGTPRVAQCTVCMAVRGGPEIVSLYLAGLL